MPPSALHDPRNADLVALLDPGSAFPAGTFAADAQVLREHDTNDLPTVEIRLSRHNFSSPSLCMLFDTSIRMLHSHRQYTA